MAMGIIDGYVIGGTDEGTVADQYNENRNWIAGEYCIYNSTLYKCNGDTTGTFDSTKWDVCSCGLELNKINSNLTELENKVDTLNVVKPIDVSKVLVPHTSLAPNTEHRIDITEDCYMEVEVYGDVITSGYAKINDSGIRFTEAYAVSSNTVVNNVAISPMLKAGDYVLLYSKQYNARYTIVGVK